MACIGRPGRLAIGAAVGALGAALGSLFFNRAIGNKDDQLLSYRTVGAALTGALLVGGAAAIPQPACAMKRA